LVESHVCPIAKVYSKSKLTCLDIEEEGCQTTYVQWVQSHSTQTGKNETEIAIMVSDTLLLDTSNRPFQCEQQQEGKFSDPHICNIFHVCTQRSGLMVDQPFMCPFPTVFKRVSSSGKAFCAHPEGNDCHGKAFYQNAAETMNNTEMFNYRLPDKTLMMQSCKKSGLYPDPFYCNAYHRCTANEEDEHYLCENQLLFNPESNICDYPINVVCEGKSLFRRPMAFRNGTMMNSSTILIHGNEVQRPECSSSPNLLADDIYCNVFFQCQSDQASVFICGDEQAFDGVECREEESVNCEQKLMLTSEGTRPAVVRENISMVLGKSLYNTHSNFLMLPMAPAMQNQKIVLNVAFDCKGRIDGHWRDTRYCDVFHACLAGEQKRSYGCNQVGERFYFDDASQKCEFASRNAAGCSSNQYFTPIEAIPSIPGAQLSTEAPNEPWKIFIQSREQFSCNGKQDGFYASRWCNVFYRCSSGIATSFLCPKMPNGARLWWVQHGSPQGVPQETAACTWPCETGRRCASSGGIIVDSGSTISESQQEAETIFSQSLCNTGGKDDGSSATPGANDAFTVDSTLSCLGKSDGVFAASGYCNVFHRCVSGNRRDFRCPRATNTPYDLWWNEQTQQCDWPCRIPCTGSVFGSSATAEQVRTENALLFSNECAGYQVHTTRLNHNPQPMVYASQGQEMEPNRSPMFKIIENPDPNYICTQLGKLPTRRFCNIYHECTDVGVPPSQTFECIDSFFDRTQSICAAKDQVPCLGGIYPYDSVPIDRNPDALQCSTTAGFQLHTSRQFCNIYYLCDGTQTTPTTFRCYDRLSGEEAIFDPFAERCDSRKNTNCQNTILNLSENHYRSITVDYHRLPDLSVLPCQYDQSYVLEHEQYCNLYHVCKHGDYHLYACVSNSDQYQPTSYFYQSNGQCAAPLPSLCPKTKTIFNYARILSGNSQSLQPYVLPDPPAQQVNYGSIPIQERVEPVPICRVSDNYIEAHERYCNLFYGCKEGELILYACVDRLTNSYGGVFQASTGNCISSHICLTNEYFRPNPVSTSRTNINAVFGSYTMAEISNQTGTFTDNTEVKSSFSCVNRIDGYYESEWCNIFYRCVAGKRLVERCPAGSSRADVNYDLWWKHQEVIYNSSSPQYFGGLDHLVRCDWPCRVQCKKAIWISKDNTQGSADHVLKQDQDQRPGCQSVVNRKIENAMHLPRQVVMYSDIPNPSNYSCPWNVHGTQIRMADPKFCNIFHECTNGKLIGSFLCIESQYDAKENDCVPMGVNNLCPPERRYVYARSHGTNPSSAATYYEAIEIRNTNPSGYECITDGIHTDTMFCNLFHACSGRTRRTFQCRQTGTDGINEGVSTFDLNTKSCTKFSSYSCPSLLYNQDFLILPVMFKPPTVSPCGKQGFFSVSDSTIQYCNMFAWCPKGHGEAKVFECVPNVVGAHPGAFDMSRRSCTSRTTCPRARHSSAYNTSLLALTLKPRIISIGKRKQFSLTSTMLENGYIALNDDFKTSFQCPSGSTGFYSSPDYCDVFHYCYETGEVSSFVCASMPNRYQLWWSHNNEQGRGDNVFCDWPCNLQGVYACPASKTILMRDRQNIGNIAQREVFEATCSSAQVPSTVASINNNFTPEPVHINTAPVFYPAAPTPSVNIPVQPPSSFGTSGVLAYQPCVPSNEWYISPSSIRCSPAFSATGYAPDPKDCSKYYICESYVGSDGMSTGMLMQCLAGLWWDQQRKTCVLPSEVACNPYNIINSQGQGTGIDNSIPNGNYQPMPPLATTFAPLPQPVAPVHVPSGSASPSGPLCRGAPLCVDVGLNILQQMKAIPGRTGWFYKCDSQCALEMRCPPGLVFDDGYQRCEWPGAGLSNPTHRLGSFREQHQQYRSVERTNQNDATKMNNPARFPTTMKRASSTVSTTRKHH